MKTKRIIALILALMLVFVSCKHHDGSTSGDKEKDPDPVEVKEKEDKDKDQDKDNSKAENKINEAQLLSFFKLKGPKQGDFAYERPQANVEPYVIEKNLANVDGVSDYMREKQPDAIKSIEKDGFAVTYELWQQPFSVYENNQYTFNNSFVTTDSVLHLYNIIYLGLLENMEANGLRSKLLAMTEGLLETALDDLDEDPASIRNAALFYTGLRLLGEDADVPAEVEEISDAEMANIDGESMAISNITGARVDYSMFKVRGNYTKSEDLKSYFKANMLYSQNFFRVLDFSNEPEYEAIRSAILLSRLLVIDEKAANLWKEIYEPISFMVESTEDLTPLKLAEIVYDVTGDSNFDKEKISSDIVVKKVADVLKSMEGPKINPTKGMQMSLLPQRAVVDNIWLQRLIDDSPASMRPVASGVDVMAVMGNDLAYNISSTNEKNLKWDEFLDRLETIKTQVTSRTDEEKRSNIYRTWLWTLEGFNDQDLTGYPTFMQNEKWAYKDLNTALASWAQLKHNTILYSKQFGAEMGGFEPIPTHHYVEPNVEVYHRLIWMTDYTRENAEAYGILDAKKKKTLEDYKDLLEFLSAVSEKELREEAISQAENDRLEAIGGEMENIFLGFYVPPEDEEFSIGASERETQNIADIQRVGSNAVGEPEGSYLEVGSGVFSDIYVVFRSNGQYYLGRGAVFNYYEFLSEERMTNEDFAMRLGGFWTGIRQMDMENKEEVEIVHPFFEKELYEKIIDRFY